MQHINPFSVQTRLSFLAQGAEGRQQLEAFIHATYAHAYDADVTQFMPLLIGLTSGEGEPLAAMGIRAASQGPLYLEHYLDAPIEETLAARTGQPVARSGIVELGNLAVSSPGATRLMIIALNAYLREAGFQWVVFTAVPALRNAFNRLGLDLTALRAADGQRLGDERERWGRYYDTTPLVMAGDVEYGFHVIERAMQLEQAAGVLGQLWQCALSNGRRVHRGY